MHVTPMVWWKRICYVISPCGRFFLHAVMRFLIESGTGANIFFVGDTLAVTAVELEIGTAGTKT